MYTQIHYIYIYIYIYTSCNKKAWRALCKYIEQALPRHYSGAWDGGFRSSCGSCTQYFWDNYNYLAFVFVCTFFDICWFGTQYFGDTGPESETPGENLPFGNGTALRSYPTYRKNNASACDFRLGSQSRTFTKGYILTCSFRFWSRIPKILRSGLKIPTKSANNSKTTTNNAA